MNLKDLIKIVRLNKKNKEVTEALGIKDIRFAKKKPLSGYMNQNPSMFGTIEEEVHEQEVELDNVSYQSSIEECEEPNVPYEEPSKYLPEINLDDIKNKKKARVAQKTPAEIQENDKAMRKIQIFYKTFEWLKYEDIDLSNPVLALKEVEDKVAAKNTQKFISGNIFWLCSGAESLVTNTPTLNRFIKIQGFTKNLEASEAFKDVLDEMMIKYMPSLTDAGALPIEARFGLTILGVLYQTHQLNTLTEDSKNLMQKPVTKKFDL